MVVIDIIRKDELDRLKQDIEQGARISKQTAKRNAENKQKAINSAYYIIGEAMHNYQPYDIDRLMRKATETENYTKSELRCIKTLLADISVDDNNTVKKQNLTELAKLPLLEREKKLKEIEESIRKQLLAERKCIQKAYYLVGAATAKYSPSTITAIINNAIDRGKEYTALDRKNLTMLINDLGQPQLKQERQRKTDDELIMKYFGDLL